MRKVCLRELIIALPVILCIVLTNAHAQQPFNTNDAPTIEKGNWQFQFLNSYDFLNESVAPLKKQNWANFALRLWSHAESGSRDCCSAFGNWWKRLELRSR